MEKNVREYLYKHIPISRALGIDAEVATKERVVLFAPFANNINHKMTVFGGSLHAVCTLACWSLLYLNLQELKVQIVITKSEIDYLAPVSCDFRASCFMPDESAWLRFLNAVQSKGRGRIKLTATIGHAVHYSATFAAIRIE